MKDNGDEIWAEWMNNYSLQEVEDAFHNGKLTEEEVEEYVKRWNASGEHFTVAVLRGHNIINR